MSDDQRCYHTTAPIALALDGIRRMETCLGAAIDRQFVSALVARLPGIAEQGRARRARARGFRVYAGALERCPVARHVADDRRGPWVRSGALPHLPGRLSVWP